jgi:hypothetical protein
VVNHKVAAVAIKPTGNANGFGLGILIRKRIRNVGGLYQVQLEKDIADKKVQARIAVPFAVKLLP